MSGDQTEYRSFVRRVLRAYGRRVAAADPEDLAELVALRVEVDAAIDTAAVGLHNNGRSWAEIAAAVGVTRQAAWARWGVKPRLTADRSASTGGASAHE